MLKSTHGDQLFRRVVVRVYYPKEVQKVLPPQKVVHHAGPKKGFTLDSIDELLMKHADQLDQLYPFWEFKMIPLAPSGREARYVFDFVGYRAVTPQVSVAEFSKTQPLKKESSESSSETTEGEAQAGASQRLNYTPSSRD